MSRPTRSVVWLEKWHPRNRYHLLHKKALVFEPIPWLVRRHTFLSTLHLLTSLIRASSTHMKNSPDDQMRSELGDWHTTKQLTFEQLFILEWRIA
jgi:hypothetical protein